MSKQRILMVVAVCFVLLGTVAAAREHDKRHKPKPDSVLTCGGGFGPISPNAITVPVAIDTSGCQTDICSQCLRSLENQGCEIIEFEVFKALDDVILTSIVFVLSCERP